MDRRLQNGSRPAGRDKMDKPPTSEMLDPIINPRLKGHEPHRESGH
jgi:hypothetical protein